MTVSSIAVRRLFSQQLAQTSCRRPDALLAWLVALQGQDYPGAKWSLGLRLPGSTDAQVEQALTEKSIVRSWVLRGTLHFVSASDVHWLLALISQRLIAGNARRYRQLELDEATLVRSNDLLSRTLQEGGTLDRRELFAVLQRNGISTEGQRGVYMLQRASLDGLIYQGAVRRNIPTFYSLAEIPAPSKKLTREEALAELARRYFTSRGPATLQDFVWWSGLAAAEARAGLDLARAQLVGETFGGQEYWMSADESSLAPKSLQRAYLLPGFDEYLLAYKDRSASLDDPRYHRLIPLNGMFPATVLLEGRVVGTWKRTFKKDAVVLTVRPFDPFDEQVRQALTPAAQRYGEFLGMACELENSLDSGAVAE